MLTPGTKLGPYQISAQIGAGGMGEVYRARDSRLNRDVAIKVLRTEKLGANKQRLLEEARAASALNHPNIVSIFDVGSDGGTEYIVMEFCAGRTLDDVIVRRGMRLPEALKIAVQIADGLAAAHSVGIIHRDLKPGNVIVSDNGQVKLLDFGLARPAELSATATVGTMNVTAPSTSGGAIAGTPAYMSPEQAEGKKLDARTDIFSFGAVFYEMLTGERAFRGDSAASTLTAVLRDEPKSVTLVAPDVPREVERVLTRCLRKDPSRRFQTSADLRVELQELKEDSDSGRLTTTTLPFAAPRSRSWKSLIVVAVLVVIVAAASIAWYVNAHRLPVALPPGAFVRPLTSFPGVEDDAALSPDGKQVAFSWQGEKQDNWDIYVMLTSGGRPLRLTTDPARDNYPAWSPDGERIAFVRGNGRGAPSQIIVVSALGGPERVVASIKGAYPITWDSQGRGIYYSTPGGLMKVDAVSGVSKQITTTPQDSSDFVPRVSPDGTVLAFIRRVTISNGTLYTMPVNSNGEPSGQPKLLMKLNVFADSIDWAPDGNSLLYSTGSFASSTIMRVYMDGRTVQLAVGQSAFRPSVSRRGHSLAFSQLSYDPNIWSVDVKSGHRERVVGSTAIDLSGMYSPDGKRLAFVSTRSGGYELWTADADGSNAAQLTNFSWHLGAPNWSPDGSQVAFDSSRDGHWNLYVMPSAGGAARQLTSGNNTNVRPSWSPDGKWLYFGSDRAGPWRIFKVSVDGGQPIQVTQKGGTEAFLSPDGKFLYYSNQNERGVWRMPIEGGEETKILDEVRQSWWAVQRDGIFYFTTGDPPEIKFYSFRTLQTTKVLTLPAGTSLYPQGGRGMAVSPDGTRILFTQIDKEDGDLQIIDNFQ